MAKKAGGERTVAAESCSRKKARIESEAKAAASKITVNLDHKLLECSACCSPLAPPLFQCTNGHITCSECRTNVEYSCSLCAEPANTRCDIMERVLGGMTAPCSFREFGCSATIPFTKKLTHEESCLHARVMLFLGGVPAGGRAECAIGARRVSGPTRQRAGQGGGGEGFQVQDPGAYASRRPLSVRRDAERRATDEAVPGDRVAVRLGRRVVSPGFSRVPRA